MYNLCIFVLCFEITGKFLENTQTNLCIDWDGFLIYF